MRIRELREERGLAQHELGALIGSSQASICVWESGKTDLPVRKLLKIAKVLGCPVLDLLGADELEADASQLNYIPGSEE